MSGLRYYPTLVKSGFVDPRGKPLAAAFESRSSGGYESGSRAARLRGWAPSSSGPNAAYYSDLETIRARSRHAVRNNSYAQSAVRTFVGNAIGTGIVPRWNIEDRELAKKITGLWKRWVDEADADGQLDFYGLQALVARTIFTSGEAIVRLRPRRTTDGLAVPLQLQVLEPDYLDSTQHRNAENGRFIRLGIEFDGVGKRRAYWLRRSHPGDQLFTQDFGLTSNPVPADQVIHCYRVDRPGQLRGVPWLAPVLVRLQQLDTYEDAELTRKKIAALFGAFVKKAPGADAPEFGILGNEAQDAEDSELSLEPGIVAYLNPGEEVQFAEPADVGGNFETFIRQQLRAIAAGVGLTYEQLTGDLTGVNYSSIRAGLLEFRRWVEAFQFEVIVYQFCRRVALTWLDYAVASGALELPGYDEDPTPYQRAEWRSPGWDWVDPQRDVNAKILAIQAGFESRDGVVAASGYHVEDIDDANARDAARAREMGLRYSTDVGANREGGSPSVESRASNEAPDDEETT